MAARIRGVGEALAVVAAAAGLVVTVLGQVPSPAFGRARAGDWFGLVPNWRFFAPNPAQHDFSVYVRPVRPVGEPEAPWTRPRVVAERRLHHSVWFPGRRADKGLFDLCSDFLPLLDGDRPERIETRPVFRVLRAWVVADLLAAGADRTPHQLALVRFAGADDTIEPEVLFVSSPFAVEPDTAITPD
ncbi:hypothetical protein [Curtobacterium poinsettiae]|nr:hypothetical protein [Curtobacterium flaccumfaciens]MCU0115130.1 hypothetical protein [Curtobacterium flaccumfaciens]